MLFLIKVPAVCISHSKILYATLKIAKRFNLAINVIITPFCAGTRPIYISEVIFRPFFGHKQHQSNCFCAARAQKKRNKYNT